MNQPRRTFFGVSYGTLDGQRRLLLPKNWRLDSDNGDTRFYIVPAFPDIIKIFDQHHFDRFMNLLESLDEEDPQVIEGQALVGSLSDSFVPDKQGRFSISQEIINFAKLEKKVVLIGAVTYGRIVSQEIWEKCGQDLSKLQAFEQSISAERKKLSIKGYPLQTEITSK